MSSQFQSALRRAKHPTDHRVAERARSFAAFGPDVRIRTELGEVPARFLRRNDRLRTRSGAMVPIAWIDHISFDERALADMPELRPIRIAAAAFGPRSPLRDTVVSPGLMLNTRTGSRSAHACLSLSRVTRATMTAISYTIFGCAVPVTALADGLEVAISPSRSLSQVGEMT